MPSRAIVVHQAKPDEIDVIGRFRYRVYIEEQRKSTKHADHGRKLLIEPADHSSQSVLFYTEQDGQLTGTVRLTRGPFVNGELRPYGYDKSFSPPDSHVVLVSRLMVDHDQRGLGAGAALVAHCIENSCQTGMVCGFVSCKPRLLPYFKRMGLSVCGPIYQHEDAGQQLPLLGLFEPEFLRKRKSLFVGVCQQYKKESPWTPWAEAFLASRADGRNGSCYNPINLYDVETAELSHLK